MPMNETARHHLLIALQEAIGEEAAMTLADHLPPTGWSDVATRRDLDHLESRLEARLEGTLHRELASVQRTLLFAILGAFTANAGIVVAVLRATGG